MGTQKTKIISMARGNCANWDNGNCLGAMMYRDGSGLFVRLDAKLAGKPCIVADGCDYFNNIVIPGVENGYQDIR